MEFIIGTLSYVFKIPLQEIRKWTEKEIAENYQTYIYIAERLKETTENG